MAFPSSASSSVSMPQSDIFGSASQGHNVDFAPYQPQQPFIARPQAGEHVHISQAPFAPRQQGSGQVSQEFAAASQMVSRARVGATRPKRNAQQALVEVSNVISAVSNEEFGAIDLIEVPEIRLGVPTINGKQMSINDVIDQIHRNRQQQGALRHKNEVELVLRSLGITEFAVYSEQVLTFLFRVAERLINTQNVRNMNNARDYVVGRRLLTIYRLLFALRAGKNNMSRAYFTSLRNKFTGNRGYLGRYGREQIDRGLIRFAKEGDPGAKRLQDLAASIVTRNANSSEMSERHPYDDLEFPLYGIKDHDGEIPKLRARAVRKDMSKRLADIFTKTINMSSGLSLSTTEFKRLLNSNSAAYKGVFQDH